MKKPFEYIDVDAACIKYAKFGGEAMCFICLEGDGGRERPLLRDCSCRGSSGWSHFDCMSKYADQQSQELLDKKQYSPDQLREIWGTCCNCKQELQNNMSTGMAAAFVNFIEQQTDYTRKEWDLLEATKFKQVSHFKSHGDEGGEVSRRILSLLEIAKAKGPFEPKIPERRLLELEADTLRAYGYFCSVGGEYEPAIGHFTRAVVIYNLLGAEYGRGFYKPMIADSQMQIEEARNRMSRGANPQCKEYKVEQLKICYETDLKENGIVSAIGGGLEYADALGSAGYQIKAQRIVTKLLPVCKRVHGPNHSLSERATRTWKLTHFRHMTFKGQSYSFVKYKKGKDKYIVRGPIDMGNIEHILDDTIGNRSMVHIKSCELGTYTPVMICGLGPSQESINGKIGEVTDRMVSFNGDLYITSYRVRLEDGNEVRIIAENLRILFDVPDDE